MDLDRTIEFILDQQVKMAVEQAKAAEAHRRFEEQHARTEEILAQMAEQHERDFAEINQILRRAARLGVQEARAERKRRQKVAQEVAELRTAQALTHEKMQSFIDSLRRGTNGGSHN
jgi:hypothetical protein